MLGTDFVSMSTVVMHPPDRIIILRLRHVLVSAWLCASAAANIAASPVTSPSLRALVNIPFMPEGDFDQFDVDETRNRLFLSAEDGSAMEVFNLRTGRLLLQGGSVKSPHKVLVDKASHHLFVADGADASIKELDEHLTMLARIPVGDDPDTGAYDPGKQTIYVSSRAPAGTRAGSTISVISTTTNKVLKTIPIAATTLKGMVLDSAGHRLLVSLRDRNQVAVVDTTTDHVTLWSPSGVHEPVPLAFDTDDRLLFVGSRHPGALQVLDAATGEMRATLPCSDVSDSMFYDAGSHTLYVSGDEGLSRYAIGRNRRVAFLGTDASIRGKTSFLDTRRHLLFVARRRKGEVSAALEVYAVARRATDQHAVDRAHLRS